MAFALRGPRGREKSGMADVFQKRLAQNHEGVLAKHQRLRGSYADLIALAAHRVLRAAALGDSALEGASIELREQSGAESRVRVVPARDLNDPQRVRSCRGDRNLTKIPGRGCGWHAR